MLITTLRQTEGLTAAGTARARCAGSFGTAAAFGTTTGFGTVAAYAPIATSLLAPAAIAWRMNERKTGNSMVDLHHPRPPDSCP